jgi:hydroxymethylbilane synthase
LNLRGNLDTRLRKLQTDQYDGIVLASAGLIRLGHADLITALIPVEELCPAIGQGALGIETRTDDAFVLEKVQRLNHLETQLAAEAERAFLKRLGGGCQVPIAGYAQTEGHRLRIQGVIATPDGFQLFRDSAEAKIEGLAEAQAVGHKLAEKMLAAGAQAVVDVIFNRI